MEITPIAFVHSDLKTKFGVPRQSGLTGLVSRITFCKEFSSPEAFRGSEGYDYVWVIWGFHQAKPTDSLTVRPPRLGGNKRMGVFATRSPFRPNGLGLSSLRVVGTERENGEFSLLVEGADMADGTPVYDVKPYIAQYDSHPEAKGGFVQDVAFEKLNVVFADGVAGKLPPEKEEALREILSLDPRPQYQEDGREYGFTFAEKEVKFAVNGRELTVTAIE